MNLQELKNNRVNQNAYIDEAMKPSLKKENKKLGQSVDLTNKQMQHLQDSQTTQLMRESLKQAGVQLLDKQDTFRSGEQKGKMEQKTKERCRVVQQMELSANRRSEEEFDQFVSQNPSINYFLLKQLGQQEVNTNNGQRKVKERLMKYFFDNVDYFRHLVGKCICFACRCGHCKCNYVHKHITDNFGTIYKNQLGQKGLQGVNQLYLNQNNPIRNPSLSIAAATRQHEQTMSKGSTNAQLYHSPQKQYYISRVDGTQLINKEPQLTNMSNYQVQFMNADKQPKEIQMIRSHEIVQNTPLVGNGQSTYNNQHKLIQPPQKHQKITVIQNPLKTNTYIGDQYQKNLSHLKNEDLEKCKQTKILQQDNISVDHFITPQHFQTQNKKMYKDPNASVSQSQIL